MLPRPHRVCCQVRDGPQPQGLSPQDTHRTVLCMLHADPQDPLRQQLQRRPPTLPGEHSTQRLGGGLGRRCPHPPARGTCTGSACGTEGPGPSRSAPRRPCPRHRPGQIRLLTRDQWSRQSSEVEITCPLLFLLRFLFVTRVKRKAKARTKPLWAVSRLPGARAAA